jgi:hypothetical protein
MAIMQIPYDLEFVENRPTVQVRAVAMDETYPFGHSRSLARPEGDVFDALLRWVHGVISRLESRSR